VPWNYIFSKWEYFLLTLDWDKVKLPKPSIGQPEYIQDFVKFLKENNAWDSFLHNFNNKEYKKVLALSYPEFLSHHQKKGIIYYLNTLHKQNRLKDIILLAFPWGIDKVGSNYWNELNEKWRHKINNKK
jgi:predicted aldo/keto reductase-like oxidoreductase